MKKRSFLTMCSVITLSMLFIVDSARSAVPGDFRELVKSAGPSVVNINTEKTVKRRSALPPGFEMFRGHPDLEGFFDQFDSFGGNGPQGRGSKRNSLGSGFVVSADGYIVTNNHVIEGADVIRVTFSGKANDEGYKAEVIGTDPDTDLALLKIDAKNLPALSFGNSEALEVGEWVLAIGNPLGLDKTVTAGIVSAKGRNINSGSYDDFLQTDASINPGNSGGPLLNMAGDVVGINTAIAQRAQGIGFAIPSSMAKKIIDDLKANRRVSRGWLGVTIQSVDAATAKALALKEPTGALIGSVMEGQPADKAGIKPGDIILTINGVTIEDSEQLLRKVALLAPNSKVALTVWRDGKEIDMTLTVAERDAKQATGGSATTLEDVLGMQGKNLTEADMAKYKTGKVTGVLVTAIDPEGIMAAAGIRKGDVLVSVNRKAIYSVEELQGVVLSVKQAKGVLLLHVSRSGSQFFRAIEFAD